MLTDDELLAILTFLPLHSLLVSAASTCHRLALVAEGPLQKACKQHDWRPTRRMQSGQRYVWRALFHQKACAVCLGSEAFFPARVSYGGYGSWRNGRAAVCFRLCRPCARRDKVQSQLHFHGLEIDSIGENGAALFARQFHTPLFGHTNGFDPGTIATKNQISGL